MAEEIIIEKIASVKEKVHKFGLSQNLKLSLASGFSKTTGQEQFDIDSAYRKADKRMYADKQQMKSSEKWNGSMDM